MSRVHGWLLKREKNQGTALSCALDYLSHLSSTQNAILGLFKQTFLDKGNCTVFVKKRNVQGERVAGWTEAWPEEMANYHTEIPVRGF